MNVYLAVFDKSAFAVSKALLGDVKSYIDEHYVELHCVSFRELLDVEKAALDQADAPMPMAAPMPETHKGLDELIEHLDEPFSDTLMKLIDAKGKTDVEVYKKANIDRKLFSKIRTGKGYTPQKVHHFSAGHCIGTEPCRNG